MGGVRHTKQKQMVYDALRALDHPTATEVYERVHGEHPTISRGTVFRVLNGFAEGGRARRVTLFGSDTRYDHTLAPHAHGKCRVCGGVSDVFLPDFSALSAEAKSAGFCIEGCEVEFYGVCAACAKTTGNMRQGANER